MAEGELEVAGEVLGVGLIVGFGVVAVDSLGVVLSVALADALGLVLGVADAEAT